MEETVDITESSPACYARLPPATACTVVTKVMAALEMILFLGVTMFGIYSNSLWDGLQMWLKWTCSLFLQAYSFKFWTVGSLRKGVHLRLGRWEVFMFTGQGSCCHSSVSDAQEKWEKTLIQYLPCQDPHSADCFYLSEDSLLIVCFYTSNLEFTSKPFWGKSYLAFFFYYYFLTI